MSTSKTNIIEKIVYTASLATRVEEIDPLLDKLREVTARTNNPEDLSDDDRTKLALVQVGLEKYLVENEPLRAFTYDSLSLQIERHMLGGASRRSFKLLIVTFMVAPLTACIIMLLPLFPGEFARHLQLAITSSMSLFLLGAAVQFVAILPAFKSKLRSAFRLICLGICILAIVTVEQPIIEAFGFRGELYTSIIASFSWLCATIPIYLGTRKYAQLAGVTGRVTSLRVVSWYTLAITLVTVVVPHVTSPPSELIFRGAAVFQAWILVAVIFCTILGVRISKRLADLYKPPTRALAQAAGVVSFLSLYIYGVRITIGSLQFPFALTAAVLLLLMSLMLLRAGYSFNKISQY